MIPSSCAGGHGRKPIQQKVIRIDRNINGMFRKSQYLASAPLDLGNAPTAPFVRFYRLFLWRSPITYAPEVSETLD
jgi:hypothetical protein